MGRRRAEDREQQSEQSEQQRGSYRESHEPPQNDDGPYQQQDRGEQHRKPFLRVLGVRGGDAGVGRHAAAAIPVRLAKRGAPGERLAFGPVGWSGGWELVVDIDREVLDPVTHEDGSPAPRGSGRGKTLMPMSGHGRRVLKRVNPVECACSGGDEARYEPFTGSSRERTARSRHRTTGRRRARR